MDIPDWALNPDDGSYPFVDWDDLDPDDRRLLLRKKVIPTLVSPSEAEHFEDAISRISIAINTSFSSLSEAMKGVTKAMSLISMEKVKEKQEAINAAARDAATRANHPSHVMIATEVEMRRASRGTPIPVVLREPCPRGTLMYGTRVAQPGDMITGVLVTDSERRVNTRTAAMSDYAEMVNF